MTLPFAHRITTFTERRKMTEKTLEQIRQEYGSRAAALMNARHDRGWTSLLYGRIGAGPVHIS